MWAEPCIMALNEKKKIHRMLREEEPLRFGGGGGGVHPNLRRDMKHGWKVIP